jgi:hypothetical protein
MLRLSSGDAATGARPEDRARVDATVRELERLASAVDTAAGDEDEGSASM